MQVYTGSQERSSTLTNVFSLQLNKKIILPHHHLGLIFRVLGTCNVSHTCIFLSLLFLLNRYSILWKQDDGQNKENAIQVSMYGNYPLPKHYIFPNPGFSELCRAWVGHIGDERGQKVEVKKGSGGGRELKCVIIIFRWICEVRGGRVCVFMC